MDELVNLELLPIVLINYDGDDDTIECVDSLLRSTDTNFQIFIVDNSPTSLSMENISKWGKRQIKPKGIENYDFPFQTSVLDVKIITNEELEQSNAVLENKVVIIKTKINNGFAAANNIALKYLINYLKFEWIWLLNNDTIASSDAIKYIRSGLPKLPQDIGIVGTKVYYYHDRSILQGVAGNYNKLFSTTNHLAAHHKDYDYDIEKFQKSADFIMGASMIVKQKFIKDTGLMDENYFLYYEELDWSLRGKERGWKLGLVPEALVYHKEGASISKNLSGVSLLADKCSIVNRLKIARKFFPSMVPIVYLSLINVFYRRIRRGQYNRIYPIVKAIYNNHPL